MRKSIDAKFKKLLTEKLSASEMDLELLSCRVERRDDFGGKCLPHATFKVGPDEWEWPPVKRWQGLWCEEEEIEGALPYWADFCVSSVGNVAHSVPDDDFLAKVKKAEERAKRVDERNMRKPEPVEAGTNGQSEATNG